MGLHQPLPISKLSALDVQCPMNVMNVLPTVQFGSITSGVIMFFPLLEGHRTILSKSLLLSILLLWSLELYRPTKSNYRVYLIIILLVLKVFFCIRYY